MNYTEFKDYIITHLWKMGDSIVIDRLDTIIQTAENELNRTFKVEDRTVLLVDSVTAFPYTLPSDLREIRTIANTHCREMVYVIPSQFLAKTMAARNTDPGDYQEYTVINKELRVLGAVSVAAPLQVSILYYRNVPKFKETDASWLADDYLDVYLYCVLKHTATFLREDERLSIWASLFGDAHNTAMEENLDRKFAGSPLKIKFPSGIR